LPGSGSRSPSSRRVITDKSQYKTYDEELRDSSRPGAYEFFKEDCREDLAILSFVDKRLPG
jgi:hypothetical protein